MNCVNGQSDLKTVLEQFTYITNFDQSGARKLLKYSRNVLKFELILWMGTMILTTEFEKSRMKVGTFIVYQPKPKKR